MPSEEGVKRARRSRRFAWSPLLLLSVVACTTTPVPSAVSVQGTDPTTVEEVQPPTLPIQPVTDPLPRIPGSVPVEVEPTLNAAAARSSRVQMRLLLISATGSDPALNALKMLCDQVGALCDTFIASITPMTRSVLEDQSRGEGRYQGIFLTDNQLAYSGGGGWELAFTPDEWNILWEYERDYGVRQVSLYTYPGSYPEPQGLTYEGGAPSVAPSTGKAYYNAALTPEGQEVFSSLKANAPVPIHYAYTYLGSLDDAVPSAKPILRDSAGNVLGVTSTSPDGRERLALTMDHSPYLLHSQLLTYDLLRWVTKDVFIGQRQFYLGIDQDDWFAPTGKWDAAVGGVNGEYRMTAQDVAGVVEQQNKLHAKYPFAGDFAWTMAFNGAYADESAPPDCSANPGGPDPLTSATLCHKGEFFWLNHTWSHAYMDRTDYATSFREIDLNTGLAQRLGLTGSKYGFDSLVTGDVSGLGWYAPGGPDTGPKVDHGLEGSNAEFLRAAKDAGVRYIASNMSVRSHEPVNCWGCGMTHPLNSSLFLIPRWPTNLFATPTTPADMIDAYNRVYGPGGSDPYFSRNLTYDEYLDVEAEIALFHIITGSPYQYYQHVGNLREYAPGHSLAYDWVERLLSHYSRYYNKPIKTLDWKTLGETVERRTSFRRAGLSGVLDMAAKTVTITSANGGALYFTHGAGATIVSDTLGAGQSKTFNVAYSGPAPTPTQQAQSITFGSTPPDVATVGGGYPVAVSASSGLPVTLSAGPDTVCRPNAETPTTIDFVGVGPCTIIATQAGNANFSAAAPQSQSVTVSSAVASTVVAGVSGGGSYGGNATLVATLTTQGAALSAQRLSFTLNGTAVGTATTDQNGVATLSGVPLGEIPAGAYPGALSASFSGAEGLSSSSASGALTVAKAAQTVAFASAAPTNAQAGGSYAPQFALSSGPSAPTVLSSSTPSSCTVSASAVSFQAAGTCTITLNRAGDANYQAATPASQTFTVAAAPAVKQQQTLTFTSAAPSNATVGGSYTVQATASSGLSVSFSSVDADVCSVSGGTVRFVAAGTCTVRAEQSGNATYHAAPPISQTFPVSAAPVVKQDQTIRFTSAAPTAATVGGTYAVSATASSGLTVTFAATTTNVCTVSGSTVRFVGVGSCTVRASQAGNATYNPAPNVTQTLTVRAPKQNQTLRFTSSAPANATVGGTYTVSATATSGLTVSFASTTPKVCTVSGRTVRFVGAGSCTVRASQTGNATYNPAPNATQTLTVRAAKQNQTLRFTSQKPTNARVGGSYAARATATSGLTVSFAATTTKVCTVSGSTVRFVGVGSCTVRASQAGNATYNAAPNVSQTFSVRR